MFVRSRMNNTRNPVYMNILLEFHVALSSEKLPSGYHYTSKRVQSDALVRQSYMQQPKASQARVDDEIFYTSGSALRDQRAGKGFFAPLI